MGYFEMNGVHTKRRFIQWVGGGAFVSGFMSIDGTPPPKDVVVLFVGRCIITSANAIDCPTQGPSTVKIRDAPIPGTLYPFQYRMKIMGCELENVVSSPLREARTMMFWDVTANVRFDESKAKAAITALTFDVVLLVDWLVRICQQTTFGHLLVITFVIQALNGFPSAPIEVIIVAVKEERGRISSIEMLHKPVSSFVFHGSTNIGFVVPVIVIGCGSQFGTAVNPAPVILRIDSGNCKKNSMFVNATSPFGFEMERMCLRRFAAASCDAAKPPKSDKSSGLLAIANSGGLVRSGRYSYQKANAIPIMTGTRTKLEHIYANLLVEP